MEAAQHQSQNPNIKQHAQTIDLIGNGPDMLEKSDLQSFVRT